MNYVELSKEVSYALRHAPWEYELTMDNQGFVPVSELLAALNETGHYDKTVTEEDLIRMMEASDKKRHEIVGGKIRALYGYSIPMKIEKEPSVPPDVLYHGTAKRFLDSILSDGLKPMSRQYVHLSTDVEMAESVGKRHDSHPVILKIDAKAAHASGILFCKGNDRVWLTDALPAKFISLLNH
jgi:putative RNA 2'-phosphotransferase